MFTMNHFSDEEEVEDRISVFFNLSKEAPQTTPSKEAQQSKVVSRSEMTPKTATQPPASNKKVFKSPKYIEESASESESESELAVDDVPGFTDMSPVPLATKCPRQMMVPTLCNQEACRNLREEKFRCRM